MTGSKTNSSADPTPTGVPKHLQGIDPNQVDWKAKDQAYWKEHLSPEQFAICRDAGTERPWTGQYCRSHEPGMYYCACCGLPLFESTNKFESGTGWPSFTEPYTKDAVMERADNAFGMSRVEVLCSRCGAHLGHVFEDGPPPTGRRYCINSVCLFRK
ncbi:MAG: peptide-methionine (R)-S-oxide reductase MsrB [Oligoflexia bacterium]|nr:peptide-methionine (R)-S-oxide reductase MsrB [Oligoflexia bacterium]